MIRLHAFVKTSCESLLSAALFVFHPPAVSEFSPKHPENSITQDRLDGNRFAAWMSELLEKHCSWTRYVQNIDFQNELVSVLFEWQVN